MTATAPARLAPGAMDTTGWCRDCRAHAHKLCEQPDCRCALGAHPKRRDVTDPPEDPLADVRVRATSSSTDLCNSCRRAQHSLCTRAECACPFERHPKRRERPAAVRPAPTSTPQPATAAKAKLREPVWELVKAEPPAPPPKPRKITAEDRTRRFVEQLVAERDKDWHRFALFPSSMAAGQVRARVAKRFPEFEFKAVRVADIGQSALYGRWTGAKPRGQL